MDNSEPVVVFYKSKNCEPCKDLSNIWDSSPNKDKDSVVSTLKKVNQKLRIYTITAANISGKFDDKIAPPDLIRYAKWFPMILLIPGRLWDAAMPKTGEKNDVKLIKGVQILNGKWINDVLTRKQIYDIKIPSEFSRWLKDCLLNEDFVKEQYMSPPLVVPTTPVTSGSVLPSISNIIKPNNTSVNYIKGGTEEAGVDNICSLKIIQRPRNTNW